MEFCARLKQAMARGHVEVRLSLTRVRESMEARYNRDLLARYVAAHREACNEFMLNAAFDLNVAFRLPGMFATEAAESEIDSSFEPEVLEALDACLGELNLFREREGAQLGELLRREADQSPSRPKK